MLKNLNLFLTVHEYNFFKFTDDLQWIHVSPFFFANRLEIHEDPIAYSCLEQRLFNRTRNECNGQVKFNTTVYKNSILVRYRLNKNDIGRKLHIEGQGDNIESLKDRTLLNDKQNYALQMELI